MECEICGKETNGRKMIELDGSSLIVCEDCSSFGKEKQLPKAPAEKPQFSGRLRPIGPPSFEREEFDLGLDLIADYGMAIRNAREGKQLTVQELARKIFEKESLMHRIESQSIKPSDALIAKIEKQLGIQLKKKAE